MNTGFYPRLAWDGIRKNKRMYFPYILTGSVMIMMCYILSYLTESPALENMTGGYILKTMLPLGCIVIAVFSLLFLFYTNSFLIRQRYREFGLYNILGMDKWNISRLLVWENGFTAIIAVIIGLMAGIALSKSAELVLLNLLGIDVSYNLSIGILSLDHTVLIFAGIYLVLLVSSLIQVRHSKPLEFLQSSKAGERRRDSPGCLPSWAFSYWAVLITWQCPSRNRLPLWFTSLCILSSANQDKRLLLDDHTTMMAFVEIISCLVRHAIVK